MSEIKYIGEQLWVGQLGHLFISLSFVASLVAVIAYYFAEKKKDLAEGLTWKKIGRFAFLSHAISVFSIIGLIFYIMVNKMYEYAYAFNHVSDELAYQYMLSAFWEGQEGSFLLWMFWHVVLGIVLLVKSKTWENGVMMFLNFIEMILASLLLGIYIGDTKIGINPFVLLRDTMDIPLFQQADYLSQLNGSGLNPLLQNYWMTIHPPTLFLGFASVAVPFCFAAAALWTKRYKEWLKPVLPWSLFSATLLGTGILMGGAWAYEALSFGGYWAWDPVENMSLVPWLILLAGIHTNLVAKATNHSLKATFAFYLLSFVLIFYSTFLTRSGILGDSSVHAFTELGLEWHLVLGLFSFIGIALYLYFKNNKTIPTPEKEENLSSKEFWIFIGSLVFLISTILISFTTSIPVVNAILDGVGWVFGKDIDDFAIPADPVAHYNSYQLWIAVFIGVLTGVAQFLRYREKNFAAWSKKFSLHVAIAFVLSLIMTYLSSTIINMNAWQYYILTFACWFGVIANLDYVITQLRGNVKMVGSALSHMGFGLMILGSIISGLNKQYISTNTFMQEGTIEGFTPDDYKKNILLFRDTPTFMSGYQVEYESDTAHIYNRYFTVNFKKLNKEGLPNGEEFSLMPNIIYDKSFTKVAASNPSTQHYWNKDIFTHVVSLPRAETDAEYAQSIEDSLVYNSHQKMLGDTIFMDSIVIKVLDIVENPKHPDYEAMPGDFAVGVRMEVKDLEKDKVYQIMPMAFLRGAKLIRIPQMINDRNIKIKLTTDIFDEAFVREDDLEYKQFVIKQGESFKFKNKDFTFNGFNPQPQSNNYTAEEGDKAAAAIINFKDSGQEYTAQPIFFIRGNMPYMVKDEVQELGLHFKIGNMDPVEKNIVLLVAEAPVKEKLLTVKVAKDVPSGEYIVLQAIVFPGINLFWLGSIMMLLGVFVAMWYRLFQK